MPTHITSLSFSLPARLPAKSTGLRIAALALALLVIAETVVRISGILDFPTYRVDDQLGYIPASNQSGAFLRTNRWVFNDRSMGTALPFAPARRPNILLIGNSVVMGGNAYDQPDKLGSLLQQDVGNDYAVWPIAAGGWTNVNEVAYLNRNPDVAASARYFVWEFMNGGSSQLNAWGGEYVFPSAHPVWGSWYALQRYILPHIFPVNRNELPPTGFNPANISRFAEAVARLSGAAKAKNPGLLFLYPRQSEYEAALKGGEWLPERAQLEAIAKANGLKIVDVAQSPEWNSSLYRDGVHPTPEGNAVLASILSSAMREGLNH